MKKGSLVMLMVLLLFVGPEMIREVKLKDKLVIVFCDVGQGDGAFIRTPKGQKIIIDTGPGSSILKCISSHVPFWDKNLDLVILSHFNMDHVSGIVDILKRYHIKRIAIPTESTQREDVQHYMTLIKSKDISIDDLNEGDSYKIEDGVMINTLEAPDETGFIEENDSSLIQTLSYNGYDVLFTGDASYEVLNPILGRLGKEIEVLKVPHHGSKTGLNEESFRNFHPQIAIISAGKNNRYGHPTKEILDLLENNQIQVRRTDEEGSIRYIVP